MSVFAGIDADRPPVVEDLAGRELRPWKHGSVSQIKSFRRCPSLWYAEKILGFTRKPTKALRTGIRVHNELERYLLDGTPPGPIGAAGIHRLPAPPVDPMLVETFAAIADPALGGRYVVLKIDLVEPARTRITDHKTTSHFKYQKSPEELAGDPQAILYVAAASPIFAGAETLTGETYTTPATKDREAESYPVRRLDLDHLVELGFRHVYYRTGERPDSRETEVRLRPDDIASGYLSLVRAPLLEMQAIAEARPALRDVPHDLSGCTQYGGCHLRALCAGLGRRSLGAASAFYLAATDPKPPSNGGAMSLLSALAKHRQQQTDAPSATQQQTPEPATPSDPFAAAVAASKDVETHNGMTIDTRAELAVPATPEENAAAAAQAATVPPPTVNPRDGVPADADYVEPVTSTPSDPVVPDFDFVSEAFRGERIKSIKKAPMLILFRELRAELDRTGRPMPDRRDEERKGHVFACPDDALKGLKRTCVRDAAQVAIDLLLVPVEESGTSKSAAASEAPSSPPETPDAPTPGPTPEEGNDVNAELTPAGDADDEDIVEAPAASPASEAPREPSVISAGPVRNLRILFVDCAPRHEPGLVYLSELLAPLMREAADELGVVHFRVPQYKRGEDNVVARLANRLNTGTLALPDRLVVETRLPAAAVCLEELISRYDVIVERLGW